MEPVDFEELDDFTKIKHLQKLCKRANSNLEESIKLQKGYYEDSKVALKQLDNLTNRDFVSDSMIEDNIDGKEMFEKSSEFIKRTHEALIRAIKIQKDSEEIIQNIEEEIRNLKRNISK